MTDDNDGKDEKDERDVLAAEYVLGTLDPDERAQAQALIGVDPGFAAIVRNWERRLGELNVLVAPVEPPVETWERIKTKLVGVAPSAEVRLPGSTPANPAGAPGERHGDVAQLTRRVRRWRNLALAMGALAAAVVALGVAREFRPDLLPAKLRPEPKIQVVEKPVEVVKTVEKTVEVPSPRPAQFVAILQKGASPPAFLLTFDLDRRTLAVRTVGAEKQTGKSYELWLVSEKFPAPQSLGVIGNEEFTVRPQLASYDAVTINDATYAVTLEPDGGSPSGAPTGPILYSGKLVQTTPPSFGSPTP